MRFPDKAIMCHDCRGFFTFSTEDQGLYGELGFEAPSRCLTCRGLRENQRRDAPHDHVSAYPLGLLSPMIATAPSRYQSN